MSGWVINLSFFHKDELVKLITLCLFETENGKFTNDVKIDWLLIQVRSDYLLTNYKCFYKTNTLSTEQNKKKLIVKIVKR